MAFHNIEKGQSSPPAFPCLLLSEEKSKVLNNVGFFSLASYKVYKLVLPEARGKKCLGAGVGWLLAFGK